jgi:hypothetical protein
MDLNLGQIFAQYGLPLTMLIVVVVAFVRGDVVPGFVYKDALTQRDRALGVAERLSAAAEIATTVVERVVQPKNRHGRA